MALGDSRLHYFPCQNLPPIEHVEDELAKKPGPANSSHLDSTSPTLFCNTSLGPAIVPALIPALFPAPTSALSSSNKLFKQFMKAYLESNQGSRQPSAKCKQSFKAKILDVYYSKLHMYCYHICQ